MNELGSVLEVYPPEARNSTALRRVYQSQILASHVFEQILTRPELMTIFESDESIDEFWRVRSTDEQQATWGPAIDLQALAEARFRDTCEV
jgi:hypothetical protein